EARAARLGAACRPSLAGAAHHAQAYAEEPVAPVAHELVARIAPCPRSNSRRPTSDHKKGPRVLRGPASD
ncbi:hypothetical protein EMIHUDRAFT_349778, partial [Emiliania huxleyi CCMP1516]|uniref:Uncharacterized protein n=2 Tax=Emiliania huxleyi TaxID=2903 RepID=A0A0D3J374_EMIH1